MKKMFQNINFSRVLWVFFYFFIFALILRGSFGYLDPDLGWHLKVGEEIAQTGSVPDINHYNYTYTGTWVDHEWLSNLLVYQVYSHWGYIALSVLFALLVVGVLVVLNIWTRRVCPKAPPFLIMLFQLLGTVACLPHFGVRMQETGVLFLALILLIIYYYNKNKTWPWLLALVPIMYLWACLHGSFLIGFVIFFFWIGVKIVEKFLRRYYAKDWLDFSGLLSWKEIGVFSGVSALSVMATFFTPYGLRLYSFLGGYKDSFYAGHIQEWLSQFHYPFQYRQLVYLCLVSAALILYIYYSRGAKRSWRLNLWTLGLTALFIFLSFKSRRHFPLMFVATFVFLMEIFSGSLASEPRTVGTKSFWTQSPWLRGYLLTCLFLAFLLQLALTQFSADPFQSFRRTYPVKAVEFLKERPQYDSLRLFNDYGWGGFMIWTMPARLLFIDGRLPQVEYQGHTYLEEYLGFFKPEAEVAYKMTDYDIGLVLIPAKDEILTAKKWEKIFFGIKDEDLARRNYLREYLSAARDWQPIYYDATAIIYKRIK